MMNDVALRHVLPAGIMCVPLVVIILRFPGSWGYRRLSMTGIRLVREKVEFFQQQNALSFSLEKRKV
jgi:hypothetical protein